MCQYQNALGVPGKGAHSYRLGGVAIVDVILTVLAALIITWLTGSSSMFWYILGGLFLTGIVLHRVFCVRSTVDRLLFSAI